MKLFARLVLAILTGGCSSVPLSVAPAPSAAAPQVSQSTGKAGVIVPLYVDPGPQWNAVIQAKLRFPSVPIVIIANVNSGPGNALEPSYATYIAKAQKAGVTVVGYVYTQSGRRSATALDADIAKWNAYYHTTGVFLDEMSPTAFSYNQAATAYAHAQSQSLVFGNPGENAPGDAGPDVINFYEQGGYPSIAFLAQRAHRQYGSGRWSYIAGAVPFNAAKIRSTAAYVRYLFATDGKEPECYCHLPTYFDRLVATLSTLPAR